MIFGHAMPDTAPPSKLMTLSEAVRRHVPDGASVATGCGLESLIPFAAGHEMVRQARRRLTLIGPISDMLFDQLIGAGCVEGVVAAWVGNVSAGLGHNFRRAAEHAEPNAIRLEEHSNFTIALGLTAAAWGVPYLPSRTLLGSDLVPRNPRLRRDEEGLLRVAAIEPDVTVLHVQRASADGHAHAWGNLGVAEEAALAARAVILTAEEIVDRAVILSDPNRVLCPTHKVVAVCHVPGGAHPSPVQGVYGRDSAFFEEYHRASRDAAGFEEWQHEWVLGVPDRAAYLQHLGPARWDSLKVQDHRYAAAVDYGY